MEKKNIIDDLITGQAAIEDFTGKKIDVLALHWKEAFGFPIIKHCGFSAISKKELQVWMTEYGVDTIPLHKITTEMLEAAARKKRIIAMENIQLQGINEIADCVHRPTYTVWDWFKNYDSCPIKKANGQLAVGKRDLIVWLEANNIQWGHYGGETTR